MLGAIGALPGAALVIGKDASAGAPFFCAAVVCISAAYVSWLCTDAMNSRTVTLGKDEYAKETANMALYSSWCTVAYGMLSLLSSAIGFTAMHSGIRTSVTVDWGFYALGGFSIAVAAHIITLLSQRNRKTQRTSDIINSPRPLSPPTKAA